VICFLCFANQYQAEYVRHASIGDAKAAFLKAARELDRYGQSIAASLHIAKSEDLVQEYPDFVLSLTKRGNLKCEST